MKRLLLLLGLPLILHAAHGQGTGTVVDQVNALRNALTLQSVSINLRLTQSQANTLYKPASYAPTYAALPDKPVIPPAATYAALPDKPFIPPVATYAALPDKPAITYAALPDKPTIPPAATYAALPDKPVIPPAATYAALPDKPFIPPVATYAALPDKPAITYAALPDKPFIPTVPTLLSAFTNDRNYLVPADVAVKPDLSTVATFLIAKTLVVAGKPRAFIITADETYGFSFTVWDGLNYYVLPLIPRSAN